MTAAESVQLGFYDACLPGPGFAVDVARRAAELAARRISANSWPPRPPGVPPMRRQKPLAVYRAAELAEMRRNFYGFDLLPCRALSFRFPFPALWTPRHLARHRDLDGKFRHDQAFRQQPAQTACHPRRR